VSKAAQAQTPRRLPFAESIGYKMRLKLSVALPGGATADNKNRVDRHA
jgi:hypothetical protein